MKPINPKEIEAAVEHLKDTNFFLRKIVEDGDHAGWFLRECIEIISRNDESIIALENILSP